MKKPARRDGTPDSKKQLLSNAKPARRQHVSPRDVSSDPKSYTDGVRLQKVLAQAGVASRRNAEIMIDSGRVEVNRALEIQPEVRVNPQVDVIRLDGLLENENNNHQ